MYLVIRQFRLLTVFSVYRLVLFTELSKKTEISGMWTRTRR